MQDSRKMMESDDCSCQLSIIMIKRMKLHFRSETQMRYGEKLATVPHHEGKRDPEVLCSAATETAHP